MKLELYVITVTRIEDGEWELDGYVRTDNFPVKIVDRRQKFYGKRYLVTAVSVEEIRK